MKLNSVILADDSVNCNIRDLCIILKDKTLQTLHQYKESHPDIVSDNIVLFPNRVNKYNISESLSQINGNNFISFWYGHGKNCAFSLENDDIITGSDNCYIFTNALVYTFSCSNGRELADVLIINGVKAFVGYTEKIQCPLGMDDITSQLVNTFLVSFIQKGKKVKDAVQDLRTAYDKAVYDESLDVFTRGYYQTNRDALVLKGNGELTLEDMLIGKNG